MVGDYHILGLLRRAAFGRVQCCGKGDDTILQSQAKACDWHARKTDRSRHCRVLERRFQDFLRAEAAWMAV